MKSSKKILIQFHAQTRLSHWSKILVVNKSLTLVLREGDSDKGPVLINTGMGHGRYLEGSSKFLGL